MQVHSCMMTHAPINQYIFRMIDKITIRKDQLSFIDEIMKEYNITLTEIAKRCQLSSTTLTRFYNGDPKHLLSSTTLGLIKQGFPLNNQKSAANANDNSADVELALVFTMELMLRLLAKDPENKEWLEENFIYGQGFYRKHRLPNAALLMEQLKNFVSGKFPQQDKSPSHQFLELVPLKIR